MHPMTTNKLYGLTRYYIIILSTYTSTDRNLKTPNKTHFSSPLVSILGTRIYYIVMIAFVCVYAMI